jgi:hypothetical protein
MPTWDRLVEVMQRRLAHEAEVGVRLIGIRRSSVPNQGVKNRGACFATGMGGRLGRLFDKDTLPTRTLVLTDRIM